MRQVLLKSRYSDVVDRLLGCPLKIPTPKTDNLCYPLPLRVEWVSKLISNEQDMEKWWVVTAIIILTKTVASISLILCIGFSDCTLWWNKLSCRSRRGPHWKEMRKLLADSLKGPPSQTAGTQTLSTTTWVRWGEDPFPLELPDETTELYTSVRDSKAEDTIYASIPDLQKMP